jgi:hypothetical protein
VLVHSVDTTEKEIAAPYFTGGAFFISALVWDESLDTSDKCKAVFDRTMIRVVE